MAARSSRLATLLLTTALFGCLAAPALAGTAWITGYGASPTSFKQGGGRYASISVTPTADSLALVTVRDSKGTIATLGYGWIKADRKATWKWNGTISAGKMAPTGTYTYWIRLTRGRTNHFYKGQVSTYMTKVTLTVSHLGGYQWGTDGVVGVSLLARPASFSIVSEDPFLDPDTNQPVTVHDSVWLTNGNNVPLPNVPEYLMDHVALTTGDPDWVSTIVRNIPSPGIYRLHWNVESSTTVTVRQ